MSIAIYKPGQGYWVRVLTATIVGILTLATASWLYQQAIVVCEKLPRTTWDMTLGEYRGEPKVGQTVNLVYKDQQGSPPSVKATAEVAGYTPATKELRLKSINLSSPDASPADANTVATADASFSGSLTGKVGLPSVNPILVQGAVVAVVLLCGSMLAYYMTAMRHGTVDFLINTDMEMKKVNWSSKRDIRSSTIVVIAASLLISLFLLGVDYVFQAFFRLVGVLVE